jgi:hypothetical protein
MIDLMDIRRMIEADFTDEWRPIGVEIIDELLAARAVVEAARDESMFRAEARNEIAAEDSKTLHSRIEWWKRRWEENLAEVQRLRGALEYYVRECPCQNGGPCDCLQARCALQATESETSK